MRSFDEAFSEHRLTVEERRALVWRLAAIRTQRLIETLLPEPAPFSPKEMKRILRKTETKA